MLYYSDLVWLPTTTSSADSLSRTGFAPCRQQELSWLGGKARWFGRLWRAGCVLWCGAWGVRVWVRGGWGWVVLLYVPSSCPHPVHHSRSRRHHRHLLPFDCRRRLLVLVSRSRSSPPHLVVEALRYPRPLRSPIPYTFLERRRAPARRSGSSPGAHSGTTVSPPAPASAPAWNLHVRRTARAARRARCA